MSRPLASLLTLLVALTTAPAAPRPKDKDRPGPYHATRLGTNLVYDDGGGRERRWEVTASEANGDETIVTVSEVSPDGKFPLEKVSVSAKGVFLLETARFKLDPVRNLRLPVKEGDTWEYVIAVQKGLVGQSATMTVGKVEAVEVPAGKFKGVRVNMVITAKNGQPLDPPLKYTRWYDPDLGLVKMTDQDGGVIFALKSVKYPPQKD